MISFLMKHLLLFRSWLTHSTNDEKHALRVSHVRERRQIEMQAFQLGLCRPRKSKYKRVCPLGCTRLIV